MNDLATRVIAVRHVRGYLLDVELEDGSQGIVDIGNLLGQNLHNAIALRDPNMFAQAIVDSRSGHVVWPNGTRLEFRGLGARELTFPISEEDEKLNPNFRIMRLQEELRDMPEYELYILLHGFSASLHTFDGNFGEIRNLLEAIAKDENADLFFLRNRDKLQIVGAEIIRLLHNFVAAAKSLVDHTRNLYRKLYLRSGRFPDYDERKNREFADDPFSHFVQDLREFCQHYRSPDLFFHTSVSVEILRSARLSLGDLRSFGKWDSLSRRYLETAEDELDVLDIVTRYHEKVINFYNWFQTRQEAIHQKELERYFQKENEVVLAILEHTLDIEIGIPYSGVNADEIFVHMFTSREFEELERLPLNSRTRAERAIEILEERLAISTETKQKIFKVYAKRMQESQDIRT